MAISNTAFLADHDLRMLRMDSHMAIFERVYSLGETLSTLTSELLDESDRQFREGINDLDLITLAEQVTDARLYMSGFVKAITSSMDYSLMNDLVDDQYVVLIETAEMVADAFGYEF